MNYQFYDCSNLPHRSSYRGGGDYETDSEAVEQGLDYADQQGFTLSLVTQGTRTVWTLRDGLKRTLDEKLELWVSWVYYARDLGYDDYYARAWADWIVFKEKRYPLFPNDL